MVIADFFDKITKGAWSVCGAILLLILAFIVAGIVKSLVIKLLSKTKLNDIQAKANEGAQSDGTKRLTVIEYIAQLVYLIVFLLFMPGIFSLLGVGSVTEPILDLLKTIWGFVPHILAAVIVLVVGNLVAKLVRQLLIPVFNKLNVNKLQDKAGIEVKDEARLSNTLAYIVYVLIMIPVVIVALQALKISAISSPAVNMLDTIMQFIPNIAVAIILIWIGTIIGKFAGNVLKQLIASTGVDAKVKELVGSKFPNFELSGTIGLIVTIVIDIFFIVQGISVLKLAVLDNIGGAIIGYMPNVLAAVLILVAAFLCTVAVDKAFEKAGIRDYSIIARVAIIVVAVFMVLNQLGIAGSIVNTAFVIIIAAVAVAFAIAFGIGGRDFAKDRLSKLTKTLDEISSKKNK